jgi:hypothetical protein
LSCQYQTKIIVNIRKWNYSQLFVFCLKLIGQDGGGIGATRGVLGGFIAPTGSNLAPPVKKLIIEKLCEKLVFFLFHIVIFIR